MKHEVLVPNLGNVTTSKVIDILVKVKQKVKKDDPLITLESDKASMDIPSPYTGTVSSIDIQEGEDVSEGCLILVLSNIEKVVEKPIVKAVEKHPTSKKKISNEPYASPFVRRMAFELGIALSDVVATGSGGRVTIDDMKTFLLQSTPSYIDHSQWGQVSYGTLSANDQASAKVLSMSWQTIPQVTHHHWIDVTAVESLRQKKKKVTLLAYIVKALVEAMQDHKMFSRAWIDNKEYITREYYHVGIACDTEKGLVVPVCRDVDQKTVLEIAKDIKILSEKAKNGETTAQDYEGRSATVSSLGGIGGGHFTPIVTHPDSFILGLGKAEYQHVYQGDDLVKQYRLPVSLSYDHRLINGADAARFLIALERIVQTVGE